MSAADFVELAEREQRADALRTAKQQALRLIAPEHAGSRSHSLTREQWRRFRASSDPIAEYPAETAQYVALYYNRIRHTQTSRWMIDAYMDEVGPYAIADLPRPILASWQYWAGVAFALIGLTVVVAASGSWAG